MTCDTSSSFSITFPANFGVSSFDNLALPDLVHFNTSGMRQAQTGVGVSMTGSNVTVTKSALSGGVAARFKVQII